MTLIKRHMFITWVIHNFTCCATFCLSRGSPLRQINSLNKLHFASRLCSFPVNDGGVFPPSPTPKFCRFLLLPFLFLAFSFNTQAWKLRKGYTLQKCIIESYTSDRGKVEEEDKENNALKGIQCPLSFRVWTFSLKYYLLRT